MKLHIHSPNPGTWCEGQHLTLSAEIMARYMATDELNALTEPDGDLNLEERVNDSSRFSTPQHQMIAIILSHSSVIAELQEKSDRWKKFMHVISASMGLAALLGAHRAGASDDFAEHMIAESGIDLNAPRAESLDFTLDISYLSGVHGDVFDKQFHYVSHFIGRLTSATEAVDLIGVFAECVYEYARTPLDITDWLVASIIGMETVRDLVKEGLIDAQQIHIAPERYAE